MERGVGAGHRSVWIGDDVVVKTQAPGRSRAERLRSLAGGALGRRTGLFHVPEIVAFDDDRGELVFERLPLTGLRIGLADPGRGPALVARVATALAAIHGGPGADPGRISLHGDFGLANVLLFDDTDRIVLIDWADADWIGSPGRPELDVAVFLISLFHHRPFGPSPVVGRHDLARAFLATYAGAAPCGLDLAMLKTVVAAIAPAHARLTRRSKGPVRALGYTLGALDLRLFLARL